MLDRRKIITDLLVWIEKNLEKPLSIDDVAGRSGYSKWHIQRTFRSVMGDTLGSHIKKMKLHHAANELLNTNESIYTIAIKYGYDCQQSFTRAFSKRYGSPPGKWRDLNKYNGHLNL